MAKKTDSAPDIEVEAHEPVVAPEPPEAPPEQQTPAAWAEANGTPRWALAGAQQRCAWAPSVKITKAEFDAAIKQVTGLKFSSPSKVVRSAQTTKRGKRWLSRA